jgi:hypothetical protein
VNPHRSCVQSARRGVAQVDNPEAVSEDLAVLATRKAFKLYVVAVQEDEDEDERAYECQVGLLREGTEEGGTRQEGHVVRPITSKHNIATEVVKGF